MSVLDGPGEGTWSVFAQKVVRERDDAREEVQRLRRFVDGCIADSNRLARERDKAESEAKTWKDYAETIGLQAIIDASETYKVVVGERDLAENALAKAREEIERCHDSLRNADLTIQAAYRERDAYRSERDHAWEHVAMLRESLKAYYQECQCQRREMNEVNIQAYRALRETEPKE